MNMRLLTSLLWLTALLPGVLPGQRKVDPRNTYIRVIAVVPHIGAGTAADPKRPQHAPAAMSAGQTGIIGFTQQISDDGRYALVEYVSRDLASLQFILNDKTIKTFVKGKDKKSDIEGELRKFKKDFDLEKFGLVLP